MKKDDAFSKDFFKDFSKESLFRVLLNQVDHSVCFKDNEHRYVLCSSSFARLLGYKTPDELVGKKLDDFVSEEESAAHAETEDRVMESKTPVLNLEKFFQISGKRATVETIWLTTSIYPLIDQDGNVRGTWSITRDITEEKSTEQKLKQKDKLCDDLNAKIHYLSTVDEVTGLYNRKYFEEIVKRNMRLFSRVRGRGYSAGFTVVLMDIDQFTKFSAEHGPESGDIVLQYIADILRSSTRCADDVFRVGNDEFALILSDTALSGAKTLTSRINEKLKKKPLVIDEEKYNFTMCYGYSAYEDQLDASELIQDADQSLFEARKKRGK